MTEPTPHGALARVVNALAGASARRPKTVVALWLLLVVGCLTAGAATGTRQLTHTESMVGDSRLAAERLEAAALDDPAVESVLVSSASAGRTARAAAELERRARGLDVAGKLSGPRDTPELSVNGGRIVLVQIALRGDRDDAGDNVAPLTATVRDVADGHAGVRLQQVGPGTFDEVVGKVIEEDLRTAELLSLPITLLILLLAFGALVAACVPLVLAITSVAAAMGAHGLISQIAPAGEATMTLVVLIGLAVGVDYSLFYVRREREERGRGLGPEAALTATAATVGRAVFVSGLTVILALAGLLVPGLAPFTSLGAATMVVVAIAILGSLTVLPAVLTLMGDRIDRGRIPLVGRLRGRSRFWASLAGLVTRRPAAALVTSACVLGALAVPALEMDATGSGANSLDDSTPVVQASDAVERWFPGAPAPAEVVVRGEELRTERDALEALGADARRATGGRGPVGVEVSPDGRTALVEVPMPAGSPAQEQADVEAMREAASATAAFDDVVVGGRAADSVDTTNRLQETRPIVVAFVLALAFVLMLAAFRSIPLAAATMGLSLLSTAATFGVLTAVFQGEWAEDLLGFTSDGTIADWVPLNAFVILFALSMDYTVLVLERMREARAAGRDPRTAAAEGVAGTAGVISSAAAVMVAVFAIFPTMPLIEMKQIGVALAAGVLLDATLVRGIALPATVALLGERGIRAPRRARRRAVARDHGVAVHEH